MSQQPLIGDEPGVEIQFAGTHTSVILRPYKYDRGLNANSFRALPPNSRFVTALPRIHGKKLSFERYSTWCSDWTTQSSLVFYAETFPSVRSRGATRFRFAIKAALNIEPDNYGHPHLEAMYHEAVFYAEHLGELQGRAVPKHYGIWVGTTPWGVSVACAFMEWAGLPFCSAAFDRNFERKDRRCGIHFLLAGVCADGRQSKDDGGAVGTPQGRLPAQRLGRRHPTYPLRRISRKSVPRRF